MSNHRRFGTVVLVGVVLGIAAAPANAHQLPTPAGPVAAASNDGLFSEAARGLGLFHSKISLKGSKKHRITVEGFIDSVGITAGKGARRIFYSKQGTVSPKELRANFGKFGRIAVKFKKRGKVRKRLPKGCTGKPDRVRRGVWKGTIKFKGEGGHTEVKAAQARGKVVKFGSYTCGEGEFEPWVILSADRYSATEHVSLVVEQPENQPLARPRLWARHFKKVGKVEVHRMIRERGAPGSFTWDLGDPKAATVAGSGVIKGSASSNNSGELTGNLKAKFIGKTVPLTGPDFEVSLFEL